MTSVKLLRPTLLGTLLAVAVFGLVRSAILWLAVPHINPPASRISITLTGNGIEEVSLAGMTVYRIELPPSSLVLSTGRYLVIAFKGGDCSSCTISESVTDPKIIRSAVKP